MVDPEEELCHNFFGGGGGGGGGGSGNWLFVMLFKYWGNTVMPLKVFSVGIPLADTELCESESFDMNELGLAKKRLQTVISSFHYIHFSL